MTPEYDDSELTPNEMLALPQRAFDGAGTAEPIPDDAVLTEDNREDLALSRSEAFQAILKRSPKHLEREGPASSYEVRRRPGL